MYIRFALTQVDEDSNRKQGILVAAHELRDSGKLSDEDLARIKGLLKWFNTHLKIPQVLAQKGSLRDISWFKADATKPIGYMWEIAHLLRENDFLVELLKTDEPGMITYEDEWQVVARPPRGKRIPW